MGNINDWITADKISGSAGETTVTLTCDANNTASSRSYTLDVELNGSGEIAHCTINQERAFASTYWIVQYVYISTLKTVLEIREDSIDGTLRYRGTKDINKNVSYECDGKSDISVLKKLLTEMYHAYEASAHGDIFNAAVIYRYSESSSDVNSYMQEVIKYPILYPQEVSSAYGSGSYRLYDVRSNYLGTTNEVHSFIFILNMDYSTDNFVYNLGLNYNSFCEIQDFDTKPDVSKYSTLYYLPAISLNYYNLQFASLTYTDTNRLATVSDKRIYFLPTTLRVLSTDLRSGNTKSFNFYEYTETNNEVVCLGTYNEASVKEAIRIIGDQLKSSIQRNINPITTSIYTTIKTLAVNTQGYEQVFNSNQVFVPTDMNISQNGSIVNITVKVYNDSDDRTYEQAVGISTPAHPMFSLRHGEITAKVDTSGSTSTVTSMTLRYVSDNE